MAIKVITPPTTEPITLSEAKLHLRVDGTTDDTPITALITAAREYCEDYQGKKYITQTLELYLDDWPDDDLIEFKDCSPVQSITSITYYDEDNVSATMAATDYILDNVSFINKIVLSADVDWPTTTLKPVNGLVIRFVAGYGAAAVVPESVKQAMLCHMSILYEACDPARMALLERTRDRLLGMRRVMPV